MASTHASSLQDYGNMPGNQLLFVLIIDDLGIKYNSLQHAQYLLKTIHEYYDLSIEWSGKLFCGITLTLDFEK